MKNEIEAKAARIDKDSIRKNLKNIPNARLICPERTLTRKVYLLPKSVKHDSKTDWIRLRKDGNKTKLAYKSNKKTIDSIKELEFIVEEFDKMDEFLKITGFVNKGYQENLRETWMIGDDIEVDIDTWPQIDSVVEIEAPTKEQVEDGFRLLGLDFEKAYFGSIDEVYFKEYGIDFFAKEVWIF